MRRITSSSKVKNSSRSESKGKKERKLQIRIDFNFYDDVFEVSSEMVEKVCFGGSSDNL